MDYLKVFKYHGDEHRLENYRKYTRIVWELRNKSAHKEQDLFKDVWGFSFPTSIPIFKSFINIFIVPTASCECTGIVQGIS